MLPNPVRAVLSVTAVSLVTAGCFGSDHPDPKRYEYLYLDGSFQPPYTEFPKGADRMNWKCYDEKTNKSFDCTFVRGGWQLYKYIYRKRG